MTTVTSTATTGSTLGVLARQEIVSYLRHKLFWLGAAVMVVADVGMLLGVFDKAGSSTSYMILPAALLGLLGLVTMFGLARRSDRAAEAAGTVAVPERTRTLALAAAVVVPGGLALVSWVVAIAAYYVNPPLDYVVPPGVSDAFVFAQMFGDGVLCAVGGPLLGLVLARYLPRRGVPVISVVVLVITTILLQGNFAGGQSYRVWWVWTYFFSQVAVINGHPASGFSSDPARELHFGTLPGNPYLWLLYLVTLCALGLLVAVMHDPESDQRRLRRIAAGMLVAVVILGIATMTVGFDHVAVNPLICTTC
jgi:hypothetical protein